VFGRTWKIATIGGIPVRIDSSLLIIAILIGYSEYANFTDPLFVNRVRGGTALLLSVFATILFFLSILLHEFAHAGMARVRSIPVSGITLYVLGGATSVATEDKAPADEFLITAVGPGTSFALAGVFWVLSRTAGYPIELAFRDLAFVNFILAVFNVIPGFPLDGGRLLRAIIWRVTGNLERATTVAAGVGMVFGGVLIALGIIGTLRGGWIFSLWSVFIGWFLYSAARSAIRQQRLRKLLSDAVVREAMSPPPRTIPADTTLIAALDDYLRGHEDEQFPVVQDTDHIVGVLTMDSASRVGQQDPLRPVRDAMVPLPEIMTVRADERLDATVQELAGRAALVVTEDGRLIGSIRPADVNRWISAHR
jgi:Zn-dependent protease/predicted transcriptional regulator